MKIRLCIPVLTLMATVASAQVPTIEREALIAMYNSTDGANWSNNNNWLGPVGTECTWRGVLCSGGHVSSLDMQYNLISGSLPPELGNLSGLQNLNLGSNQLRGSIPPELGNLSNLQNLALQRNSLTGSIPPELGNLSNLESLALFSNRLGGSIPPELGNTSLVRLFLDSNQLSGSIPPELGNLAGLETLDLYSNCLSGSIPSELGNLSAMRLLYLHFNSLSGSIPPELGNLSNLLELRLNSNHLSGNIPPELGNLSTVMYLQLDSNHLSGSIPPELGNLSSAETLMLNDNQLSGSIPPELGNLSSSLVFLSLGSNRLSGSIPTVLGSMMGLEEEYSLINYNALWTDDTALAASLWPGWDETQTITPEQLTVVSVADRTVWLEWTSILYTGDRGGYEVFSQEVNGSVISSGFTYDKLASTFPVTDLQPGQAYDFTLTAFTKPHPGNQSTVVSDPTGPVMATTSDSGCVTPSVSVSGNSVPYTLGVTSRHNTIEWSTGATTTSIQVTPLEPKYYWVRTTGPGSCHEAAVVLVAPMPILADGFETGDLESWSGSTGE
jgi:Leucine-rich repeat (LRR) protein